MSDRPAPHPNADVRMRGFSQRSTVEDALAWVDSVLPPLATLPIEKIDLFSANGRVLAENLVSQVNVPHYDRSMMDGFAVRGEETLGATAYNPLQLRVIGNCFPGAPFEKNVQQGEAVRIMTGAPLPSGADAVLPVEDCEWCDETLQVQSDVPPGKHVGKIGEDIRIGDVLRWVGQSLRPQDLGVCSAIGISQVTVVRRPRVRIVITGNELLPAGTPPDGYRIADANGPMLSALVARDGGEIDRFVMVHDQPELIRQELLSPGADVILVSGGSSVGQEDFVPTLLAREGELAIHGIAMRPSSPAGMGRLGQALVFLLPGNPVSCLCAYDFFAGRAIRGLGGRSREWPYRKVHLPLKTKLVSTVGRLDYARVRIQDDQVEPISISGASLLSTTTRAQGFVLIPADSEGFPQHGLVDVYLYDTI